MMDSHRLRRVKTYLWYAGDVVPNKKGTRIVGIPHGFGAIAWDMGMSSSMRHMEPSAALVIEPQCSRWDIVPSTGNAEAVVTYWKPESASVGRGDISKKQDLPRGAQAGLREVVSIQRKWFCSIRTT